MLLHRFSCYPDLNAGPPAQKELTETLIASRKDASKQDKGIWLILRQSGSLIIFSISPRTNHSMIWRIRELSRRLRNTAHTL